MFIKFFIISLRSNFMVCFEGNSNWSNIKMENKFKSASAILLGLAVAGAATALLLTNESQKKIESLGGRVRRMKKERELRRGNINGVSDCFI